MKIAVLVLSFLLIHSAVCQQTRQDCIDAGITNTSLPEVIPVQNPGSDNPCTSNSCCTSAYIEELKESIDVRVFRKCVYETFDEVIENAEEFFDDFADSFGSSARDALFSSFSARAEIGSDTLEVYIDNELTYVSQLLANLTFSRIMGSSDDTRFEVALQEYACDYLASVIQKKYYTRTLKSGRISGKCLCNLRIPGTDETVLTRVQALIKTKVIKFTNTINNIAQLIRAVSIIRTVSLHNLFAARDFNVSSTCIRQYINAVACQHCQGDSTRACPSSCRLVSLLCLQPLRNAFERQYDNFIVYVSLALTSIINNNSLSTGDFDFHSIQETAGDLTDELSSFAVKARTALTALIPDGETLEDSDCFITRSTDIDDGRVVCRDTPSNNDKIPACTRKDGDREIVDAPDLDSDDEEKPTMGGDSDVSTPTDPLPEPLSGKDTNDGDESGDESDNKFEDTLAEVEFSNFVNRILSRFRQFGNFKLIFNRINACVCKALSSGMGNQGSDSDDESDEDRITILFVSPPEQTSCYKKFAVNLFPEKIEDNPAYLSLSDSERRETGKFDEAVSARFLNLEQLVADDPTVSAIFEQLMGQTPSDAGRIYISLLLALFSAVLTLLFLFV